MGYSYCKNEIVFGDCLLEYMLFLMGKKERKKVCSVIDIVGKLKSVNDTEIHCF